MNQALRRFGLVEIAEKYELGKKTWDGPDQAAALDSWWIHTPNRYTMLFLL
jgi:hypothetical protein